MGTRVLLVDDEETITSELAPFLERPGYEVAIARDGDAALRLFESSRRDIVILDVVMPEPNGREVYRGLRASGSLTPVIMLTTVGTSAERALTLEEGADDDINKSFDPIELLARIKAVLRRSQAGARSLATPRRLVVGDLVVDLHSRRAFLDHELTITAKSLAVLEFLMLHQDEVISRGRLLDEIWGWDHPSATRAVDVRIAELRRALDDDALKPVFTETVVNEGARLVGTVGAER